MLIVIWILQGRYAIFLCNIPETDVYVSWESQEFKNTTVRFRIGKTRWQCWQTFPLQRQSLLGGSSRKDATWICMWDTRKRGLPDLELEIYSSNRPFQRLLTVPECFLVLIFPNPKACKHWNIAIIYNIYSIQNALRNIYNAYAILIIYLWRLAR